MAGIYIHIPFCKQACHYCDFHFSTSLKKKGEMVEAICEELVLRRGEIREAIETIYFGGGTPSLLTSNELQMILDTVYAHYPVVTTPEITLEANPDDLTEDKLHTLRQSSINRLSIGVQSFFDDDIRLMNRAHNSQEALFAVKSSLKFFSNISIDLIYGIPGMNNQRWKENLNLALELGVPHISSYALTVEPKTALKVLIEKGKIAAVDEEHLKGQYDIMVRVLEDHGFDNYEFSNFAQPGFFSRNNTAYWFGKPYLGIGPSAHSFNGTNRQWNINNNSIYIRKIQEGIIPAEVESLTETDRYNELVMTRLRTKWGISIDEVEYLFGSSYREYILREAAGGLERGTLSWNGQHLVVAPEAKFLTDGIAADLFLIAN